MLCLTIKQPWVWSIFSGGKDVENRDWSWPETDRARLPIRILISASSQVTRFEFDTACDGIRNGFDLVVPPRGELPFGAIVGAVTVTECVTASESPWFVGRYGFVLTDKRLLPEPVPCVGQRGLWTVPRDVAARIRSLATRSNQ